MASQFQFCQIHVLLHPSHHSKPPQQSCVRVILGPRRLIAARLAPSSKTAIACTSLSVWRSAFCGWKSKLFFGAAVCDSWRVCGGSTEVGEIREGVRVNGFGWGGRGSAWIYWTAPRHIRRQAVSALRVVAQRLPSVRGKEGMSPSISPGSPCSSPGASSISQHFLYKDLTQSMFTSNLIGWQFKLLFPSKEC